MKKLLLLFPLFISMMFGQSDPNADPNWDWRNGDYPEYPYPTTQFKMYIENGNGQVIGQPRNAPWGQGDIPLSMDDNRKEDGWVLVARDFGTPTRPIYTSDQKGSPFFVIYNRYRQILRFFIRVVAQQSFVSGAIELKLDNTFPQTAVLTNLSNRAYATDKLSVVKDNVGSALTIPNDGNWAWADFNMSYDPVAPTSSGTALSFRVFGTVESEVKMDGTLTGISGEQQLVRDYMSGASTGTVTVNSSVPATVDASMDLLLKKVSGTQQTWDGWKTTVGNIYNKLPIMETSSPISVLNNNLKLNIGSLKDSWLVQSLPFLGAAVGLIDYLVVGGVKSDVTKTAPTFFGMNLGVKGTITTKYVLSNPKKIAAPGTKSDPSVPILGSYSPILYSNRVGLFCLTATPVLKYRGYQRQFAAGYPYKAYYSFRISDPLQFVVNPNCGLVLDYAKAWINMDATASCDPNNLEADEYLNKMASDAQAGLMELETSVEKKFTFRSKRVDVNSFAGQVINGPNARFEAPGVYQLGQTPDMTIKIEAVFHRSDDPLAQPVVSVVTFEPNFVWEGDASDPYPQPAAVAPSKPSLLAITVTSGKSAKISWQQTDDLNVNPNGTYQIFRRTSIRGGSWSSWSAIATVQGNTSSYIDGSLPPTFGSGPNLAEYKVRAVDNASLQSEFSDSKQIAWGNGLYKPTDGPPDQFALAQNYPNPFNPSTTIAYTLPQDAIVSIKVYDQLGREVETLVNGYGPAGRYSIEFDGSKLASGVYTYRLVSRPASGGAKGTFIAVKKMLLVK